jgi:hypothetical protein
LVTSTLKLGKSDWKKVSNASAGVEDVASDDDVAASRVGLV